MALQLTTRSASISLRDNNGKSGLVSVSFPSTTTPADVVTAAGNLAPLVAALSNAAVVGATATFTYVETEPTTPGPQSEIERRLVLTGRAQNGGVVRVSIPSAIFELEQSGTDAVSLTNAQVAALVTFLTGNAASVVGSPIASISKAYISHRYRAPK
jgi:hypothetical protein